MPTTKEASIQRARVSNRQGAGGEPSGEPPAPPAGILDRVPDDVRRQLPDDVVDELLAGARTEDEIVGPGGLLAQLTKRLVERALEVELTDHLGYEPHREPPGGTGNTRNGRAAKTLVTEHGQVQIDAPRDRDGTFEPKLVRKRQRRFEGFDEKILALYGRGMSTRDIEAHLRELYGVSVGRDLISRVTDAVMDDVREWQARTLEDTYPVLFLDCMMVKTRDCGSVQRKACYLALAIGMDGEREVLGMWFQETEGAKFWMQVLTERGAPSRGSWCGSLPALGTSRRPDSSPFPPRSARRSRLRLAGLPGEKSGRLLENLPLHPQRLFSRRRRASSSRSSVERLSGRVPSSRSACLTQLRNVTSEIPRSSAI
jgi:hypothetical protein